jgi:hypothetical protein
MGSTGPRSFSNFGLDSQTVQASSVGGYIYDGCLTCGSARSIKGQWDAVVGENVCFDGSVSFYVCGAVVSAIDQCIYFADQSMTHCHLSSAYTLSGANISRPGDSGGPVIVPSSGNGYAVGTIVGFTGSYASGIYQPMSYILTAYGATLKTS